MERVLYQRRKHQLTYQSDSQLHLPHDHLLDHGIAATLHGNLDEPRGGLQTVPGKGNNARVQTMGGNSSLILLTILCIFG